MKEIEEAHERLEGMVIRTPLERSERLSGIYEADIYLKREDRQIIRAHKVRGAYNFISLLDEDKKQKGIVAASTGNHAQGVAFSCSRLRVKGDIYMPTHTPGQKIQRVKDFGKEWITIHLEGQTYDESFELAQKQCISEGKTYVHSFDDPIVIAGQGTVGLEISEQLSEPIDYLVVPVGGGGLVAGVGMYFKANYPDTKIIAVEPEGAPSMKISLDAGKVVKLESIDKFVDGAAVQAVGSTAFDVARNVIDQMILVPEGRVCQEMISFYDQEGIVVEPAGALATSALDIIKDKIKGKTVVCIVSGGNNDMSRYPEIMERAKKYEA